MDIESWTIRLVLVLLAGSKPFPALTSRLKTQIAAQSPEAASLVLARLCSPPVQATQVAAWSNLR